MQRPPVVFGLDAATRRAGWAVVHDGRRVASGTWTLGKSKDEVPARLVALRRLVVEALDRFRPSLAVVEAAFMAKSPLVTLRLGEAQGVALEPMAARGVRIVRPAPSEWKKPIAGSGAADKERVAQSVRILLGGYAETFASDDESDALALALYGERELRAERIACPI